MGDQHPERALGQGLGRIGDHDAQTQGLGPGLDDADGLGVGVGVDDEHVAGLGVGPVDEGHRLGRGRRLVEHRRVGDLGAGEVGDGGLEGDQRLQPTLGDLGLVGRVGGVPGRVLEHVATDHRRGDRAVEAHADQRRAGFVGLGQLAQGGQHRSLVAGLGHRRGRVVADRGGHDGVDQGLEVGEPEQLEHLGHLVVGGADVAPDEGVGRGQVVEGGSGAGFEVLGGNSGHGCPPGFGAFAPGQGTPLCRGT